MTVYFASFALAQLLFGPVSALFGRRPVLLVGTVVFVVGSVICAVAQSFTVLLIAAVLQATGAAATIVMSRDITRDDYEGAALTRALATITIIFALVSGLSPLLGRVLEQFIGWRAAFWTTALAGVAVLFAIRFALQETSGRARALPSDSESARELM